MKKILFLTLVAIIMVGCETDSAKSTYRVNQFDVIEVDSCEYLKNWSAGGYYSYLAHKGNCRFCKERDSIKWEQRKKELLNELKK